MILDFGLVLDLSPILQSKIIWLGSGLPYLLPDLGFPEFESGHLTNFFIKAQFSKSVASAIPPCPRVRRDAISYLVRFYILHSNWLINATIFLARWLSGFQQRVKYLQLVGHISGCLWCPHTDAGTATVWFFYCKKKYVGCDIVSSSEWNLPDSCSLRPVCLPAKAVVCCQLV